MSALPYPNAVNLQQQQPQQQPAVTASPLLPSPSKEAVVAVSRPVKSGALDLRAEEEAARRLNAGKVNVSGQASGSSKNSDLFGKGALRNQLVSISRELRLDFDEEALQYLALAAEARLRSLLQDALSAQLHRTTSSHVRPPPHAPSGKPLWSHVAMSDTQAVIDAINRANKEAEQTFRASRMDRLARETELQRAKEKADKASNDDDGMSDAAGPSTPAKPSPSSFSTPGGGGTSTPTFGGVSEKKSVKKSGKKAKDVSAEVAHKMSNATAMRSVGMFSKKQYSWLNSVPNVSSPLSGKIRKADRDGGGGGGVEGTPEPQLESTKGKGSKTKSKNKGGVDGGEDRPKRKRPKLSQPTRREVVVGRDDKGVEKKIQDDRAVTVSDVLFALERDGLGKGMGSTDELVRRVSALGGAN